MFVYYQYEKVFVCYEYEKVFVYYQLEKMFVYYQYEKVFVYYNMKRCLYTINMKSAFKVWLTATKHKKVHQCNAIKGSIKKFKNFSFFLNFILQILGSCLVPYSAYCPFGQNLIFCFIE